MLLYLEMIDAPEDRDRFEQVYIKYKDIMYRTACRILNNRQDAEDAVHMAFVSIIGHLDQIRQIDHPQTHSLVVLIAERKAIDILRARRREKNAALDESIPGIDIPLPGDNGLADALAKLPGHYREILLLRYDNGYSARELSKLLGISESGVRKLIGRAKKALQKQMEEEK